MYCTSYYVLDTTRLVIQLHVLLSPNRVLSYPDHLTIVTALMLLDKALLSPSTLSYQMDQLLYILGGDQYIPPIEEGDEEGVSLLDQLPPRPHYIPQELFAKLYSVPVDPVALEAVRLSMIEGEEQWAGLLHPNEEQVPKVLPWQEANTLDDLVVFRTFSAPLLKSRIVNDAVRFNQTLAPRSSLMDILSNMKGPLLVLYDTTELMSQANSMIFDEMMRSVSVYSCVNWTIALLILNFLVSHLSVHTCVLYFSHLHVECRHYDNIRFTHMEFLL